MQKRTFKQLKIGGICLLIIVSLAGGIFALSSEEETCADGLQNQGEAGVDCGGPCSLCEFQTIRELQIKETKFFPTGQNLYDTLAVVENPNPNYGLERLAYTFVLKNAQGEVLAKKEGDTFILPNQKKYIVEANLKTFAEAKSVEIIFAKTDWKKLEGFDGAGLFISNKRFENTSESGLGAARAIGVVKNSSPYDWNRVFVETILYGQNRQIIGAGKTEVHSLLSGQEREFTIIWPDTPFGQVFDTEMVGETNVFAEENFLRRFSGQEKFQEF